MAPPNFRWPKTCFARGRKQASPGDHVKKISSIFLGGPERYFLPWISATKFAQIG